MKRMVLLAVMSNLLTGNFISAENKVTRDLPSSTFLNVAYGDDPKQVMDIYLPAGRSAFTTKVMLLIHGGGWSGGDKHSFVTYIDSLKNYLTDYAFVNINYRLANYSHNKFPAQENDIKAALSYVWREKKRKCEKENRCDSSISGKGKRLRARPHQGIMRWVNRIAKRLNKHINMVRHFRFLDPS